MTELKRYPLRPGEREFLADPDKWPHLVCPVKRLLDGKMELGVVTANLDNVVKPWVFRGNFHDNKYDANTAYKYVDLDALIADGWVVD